MCLGIPGAVVEVTPEEHAAVIETFGIKQRISTFLVGDVNPGEYVIVHTGYAIEKVDMEEARERIKLWEELLAHEGVGEIPGSRDSTGAD
ncbi:MAG TPA: HypC/HybG/HupF family hydrogenase formation chaperone [Desulfotomaculum sp.]|nr:HypC/HybG/HupF family hydrogenase formation chaperone [Desulfotomaculum sp.]